MKAVTSRPKCLRRQRVDTDDRPPDNTEPHILTHLYESRHSHCNHSNAEPRDCEWNLTGRNNRACIIRLMFRVVLDDNHTILSSRNPHGTPNQSASGLVWRPSYSSGVSSLASITPTLELLTASEAKQNWTNSIFSPVQKSILLVETSASLTTSARSSGNIVKIRTTA